jgi:hypothetical protein
MSDCEVAWAAGFLDGEGCFSILPGEGYLYCTITAGQTNKDPLRMLFALFGGGVTTIKRVAGHKQVYIWRVTGRTAADAARRLLPYLIVKHEQADILIEFGKTISNGSRLTSVAQNKRLELKTRITELNQRGDNTPLDTEPEIVYNTVDVGARLAAAGPPR